MKGYDITTYLHYGHYTYKLQLYQHDLSKLPSLYLTYRPALMFPTMQLHKKVGARATHPRSSAPCSSIGPRGHIRYPHHARRRLGRARFGAGGMCAWT